MAMPLITSQDIINVLESTVPSTSPVIEVSDQFPNDLDQIRYGVFVKRVVTVDKAPYQLGVQYGGAIYIATDSFDVLFISYQDDDVSTNVQNAIQNLSSNLSLMNGYHEIDYTHDFELGNRSEKHTYTFTLKRLEFLTS